MLIPVPQWREAYNPLRGLTVARLNSIHDAAARGQYAAAQWLYKYMQSADVTIQAAVERRLAFVDALTWQIRTVEAADPALARDQAETLRQAYNRIENLRDASRALALSAFTGYAIIDKVPAGELFPDRLDEIPPWFWVRPRGRPWELNPEIRDECPRGEPVEPARLVTIERTPAFKPIAHHYHAKVLASADWDAMLQASANPSAFFVAPESHNTDEKLAEFQAIAEQLVSNGRGALPHGTELKTIDLARPGSRPPFAERIDYCDRQIVMAATGGILTMLTESGSGTLAGGAHSDALFQLARADAGKLSETYQQHLDAPILRATFPGQPVAAFFEFDVPQTENTAKLLEAAANLNWAGYRVDQKQLEEKTGLKLIPIQMEAPQ
jgi:phage gp29-like protein